MGERAAELVTTRLRILAALDLAIGQLLAEEVKEARTPPKMTWQKIGDALGMSDSRANVRWKGIEEREADRTGQRRRAEYDLQRVSPDEHVLVNEICQLLAERILNPRDPRPWASVLGSILLERKARYQASVDRWGRTTFHLTELGVYFLCQEPGEDNNLPEGIIATVPSAVGLSVNYSTEFRDPRSPRDLRDQIDYFVDGVIALVEGGGSTQ